MDQPFKKDTRYSVHYYGFSDSRSLFPPQQWENPVGGAVWYDHGSEGPSVADSAWDQAGTPPQGPLHPREPLTASSLLVPPDVPTTVDSPTISPSVSSTAPIHDYRVVDEQTVDEWLMCRRADRFKYYQCKECPEEFETQLKARLHVQARHMEGIELECVVSDCKTKFSSESSAKRHKDCQTKRFMCEQCNNLYARKDYISSPDHRAICRQRSRENKFWLQ